MKIPASSAFKFCVRLRWNLKQFFKYLANVCVYHTHSRSQSNWRLIYNTRLHVDYALHSQTSIKTTALRTTMKVKSIKRRSSQYDISGRWGYVNSHEPRRDINPSKHIEPQHHKHAQTHTLSFLHPISIWLTHANLADTPHAFCHPEQPAIGSLNNKLCMANVIVLYGMWSKLGCYKGIYLVNITGWYE